MTLFGDEPPAPAAPAKQAAAQWTRVAGRNQCTRCAHLDYLATNAVPIQRAAWRRNNDGALFCHAHYQDQLADAATTRKAG